MFSRVRIAIRFFFVGLAVGVLLAPRSGRETRRLVRERADRLLNDVLDAATLGTYESGAGATDDLEEAEAAVSPRRTRSRADGRNTPAGSATPAGASD
jgi:gas vesicle protein